MNRRQLLQLLVALPLARLGLRLTNAEQLNPILLADGTPIGRVVTNAPPGTHYWGNGKHGLFK